MSSTLKRTAAAYVFVYGCVHIWMPFLGIYSGPFGVVVGMLVLALVGCISAYCALVSTVGTRRLGFIMSICYSGAFVFEWFGLVPWTPPFSHVQYLLAAVLNLIHGVGFFILALEE